MSYARFKGDERAARDGTSPSDVYVYLDVGGFLNCCGCNLDAGEIWADHRFYTTADMIAHLEKHVERGQRVPARCWEGLRRDARENDAWIAAWKPRS
jgi:hypothetical protein